MTQQERPIKLYDYCQFQGGTSDIVLCVPCLVSVSVLFSPSMCLDDYSMSKVS